MADLLSSEVTNVGTELGSVGMTNDPNSYPRIDVEAEKAREEQVKATGSEQHDVSLLSFSLSGFPLPHTSHLRFSFDIAHFLCATALSIRFLRT